MTALHSSAEDYLLADLSVIPTLKDKRPALSSWAEYQTALMDMDQVSGKFNGCFGIAVICGKVSGNLECIDFDSHDKDIDTIYNEWKSDQGIDNILTRNKPYIERSPRGGIHVFYRYDCEYPEGSRKLANWESGESMIETKGEGGYVIVSPSPGYIVMENSLINLPTLQADERDYLISHCIHFNRQIKQKEEEQESNGKGYDHTDPVSWFNWNKASYAKQLLKDNGWSKTGTDKDGIETWTRPGKEDGVSATWGKRYNALYCFTSSVDYFKPECYYTPFQILIKLRFKGNHYSAYNWILHKYLNEKVPYIRVGTDYYKKINKTDRFDVQRTELKPWTKDEIKQDEGKPYLETIPKFDDFTIEPDNFNYHPVLNNCYNLYGEFAHKPQPGQWKWTEILLRHIFQEQYHLGLRYIQALYLYPKRMLPILVLVSKERQTGKTTFLNWLNMIFGSNMVNISPEDLAGAFNHIYATANIIGIEETLIEKSVTVEKLKALATGKFISVNQKFVQQYKIPFYGKIIIASNNEDKFAKIDEEEIRFFIRKIQLPQIVNHGIEDNMKSEIPAFLHYLTTLPAIDWSRDRSGFTPEEIENETLKAVKEESKNWLYKELKEYITDWFNNNPYDELYAVPADIKAKWYQHSSKAEIGYIRSVIKNDFKLTPQPMQRYLPVTASQYDTAKKSGTPFCFKRNMFTVQSKEDSGVFVKNDTDNDDENVKSKKDDLPF